MHSPPVAEEFLIGDAILFAEEDRHFERWLPVRLRVVVEGRMSELVVDFVPSHFLDVASCE